MRPGAGGELGGAVGLAVAAADDHARVRPLAVARGRLQVVVVVALVDDVPPGRSLTSRVDPRLQRHPGRQMQRGGVRDRDPRVRAVERQRLPVLAGRRPGRVRDASRVAVPRRVRTVAPDPSSNPYAATNPDGAAEAGPGLVRVPAVQSRTATRGRARHAHFVRPVHRIIASGDWPTLSALRIPKSRVEGWLRATRSQLAHRSDRGCPNPPEVRLGLKREQLGVEPA